MNRTRRPSFIALTATLLLAPLAAAIPAEPQPAPPAAAPRAYPELKRVRKFAIEYGPFQKYCSSSMS